MILIDDDIREVTQENTLDTHKIVEEGIFLQQRRMKGKPSRKRRIMITTGFEKQSK